MRSHLRRPAAGLLLALLFLLLPGCIRTDGPAVVCDASYPSGYQAVLEEILPEYTLEACDTDGAYYSDFSGVLQAGFVQEVFDAQAVPLTRLNPNLYWYPHFAATAVIAVDRAQTDAVITGWGDLADAGVPVGLWGKYTNGIFLLAAMSFALEGPDYSLAQSTALLTDLQQQGLFRHAHTDAPVLICFDYQAAALRQQGRDLEIIIPAEGTLTFQKGLLSAHALPQAEAADQLLLDAGLRLSDGRCSPALYPPAEDYVRAAPAGDFGHLAQTMQRYDTSMRRGVLHTRLYSSANEFEHHLFTVLYMIAVVFWTGLSYRRILQPHARRLTLAIGCLLIGWVLLRFFKYQIWTEGIVTRLCWYGYYAFQLSLPLVLLCMVLSLEDIHQKPRRRRWKPIVFSFYAFLLLAVFTNDFHQLIFRMDLSRPDWGDNYTYGPLYFVILAASILPILVSIVLLLKKSWVGPYRAKVLFPIGFCALLLLYMIGYVANIPLARDSDFVFVVGVFSLLFFESAMHTGLMPINHNYNGLFSLSPLKMQIVDPQGRTVLSSAASDPLLPDLWAKLQSGDGAPVLRDENTLIYASAIPGGAVLWQEDIGPLQRLHRAMEENVRRLTAANALLSKERDLKAQRAAVEHKAQLMTALEAEIQTKMRRLSFLAEQLPGHPDPQRQIGKITMLLCHIKRRSSLFFREQETQALSVTELAVYLDEMAEFAPYAGIRLLTSCSTQAALPPRQITLLYDFFYAVLAACAQLEQIQILEQLLEEGGSVVMKLLPSDFDLTCPFPDEALRGAISAAGGRLTVKQLDDTVGLSLSFPKGGVFDG